MKILLLLSTLLGLALTSQAQDWKNPLPLDSASGYVTYRGRLEAPGQGQQQTLARAARYARTQLTDKPLLVDSSRTGQATIVGEGARGFTWRGGPAGSTGRTLYYVLKLQPRAGYYEYELGELTNETPAVQYSASPGIATTIAPKRAAVEAVLRNPTSYDKKRRPIPALRSYCEAVNEAAQAVLNDARAALDAR